MSFAVYKASAGSGKTFSLVREYIRILMEDPSSFRNILAITFTNKVANEMKERILKYLRELAKGEATRDRTVKDTLLPMLSDGTGLPASVIALRASESLELILHGYSDFAIGTIDSFSHRIIRTFAHDFGLPVSFNVELDSDELLETAVNLLLDRVGDDEQLTPLLVDFLENRVEDERDWNIERDLKTFAANLLDEEGQVHIAKLKNITLAEFKQIAASIQARIRKTEAHLAEIAGEALTLIRSRNLPDTAFYQGNNGISSWFRKAAEGNFSMPKTHVKTTVEEDKWVSGKASAEDARNIQEIRDGLLDVYERMVNALAGSLPLLNLLKILAKSIYPLAVLNEIGRVLEEFKRQNNLVHISEFNSRISRMIMGESVPFIYERLGEKYHHILIDEFQDTSSMQWMNFVPLVENALAAGYFNLVVGDGKQAIYRWRNGDVEQFTALPSLQGSQEDPVLKDRERLLRMHHKEISLKTNFRSGPEIVDFNNRFFRALVNVIFPDGNKIYEELEQVPAQGKAGGYIGIQFLAGDEEEEFTYEEASLGRILEITREALDDGYLLSDIAILCRSNDHASEVARYLLLNGIDVISAESLLVGYSPEVQFILGFLKLLYLPPNALVIAELSAWMVRNDRLPGTSLHIALRRIALTKHPEREFEEMLREAGINSRPQELATLPLYDLAEELIRLFGLDQSPDPYLRFFLDAVLKFTARSSSGALEFLEWWEVQESKLSIVVPEGIPAVRVMTIHKAKGLQFPIVIFPFADDQRKMTKRFLWVDLLKNEVPGLHTALVKLEKDLGETDYAVLFADEEHKSMVDLMNLLYVVMTRPEERLYILTKFPPEKSEKMQSLPAFFSYFLRLEGAWEDSRACYEYGRKARNAHAGEPAPVASPPEIPPQSSEWRSQIRVKMRAPEMWDIEDPQSRSRWGSRVHTVLSEIRVREDLEDALQKGVLSGLIAGDEVEHIGKVAEDLFRHPALSRLFSSEVRVMTEAEILLTDGEFIRPDRVVFDGEKVFVVDYKTGRQNERHKIQLNRYAAHLEEMGYTDVKKILVYLEPKPVVIKY